MFAKRNVISAFSQPHNDYLKILYNNGILGLLFFTGLIVSLAIFLIKWKSHTPSEETLRVTSSCYLIALMILMLTDNPLVYHFFLYPAVWPISYLLFVSTTQTRRFPQSKAST